MRIPFSVYDFFGYLAAGFIWLVAIDAAAGLGMVVQEKLPPLEWAVLALAAYILGQINANLSSWVLERLFVAKVLGRSHKVLMADGQAAGIWPRLFPGYFTAFSAAERERMAATARAREVRPEGEVFFHHARTIAKSCDKTWAHMQAFLAQYGFCRNVCFALFAAGLMFVGRGLWTDNNSQVWMGVGAEALAVGMLYRYLKFIRQYSYEMFSAYPDLASAK